MRALFFSILCSFLVFSQPQGAHADFLGMEGVWEVHSTEEQCYAISFPVEGGTIAGRKAAYVAVSNFKHTPLKNSLSIVSGFDDTAGIEVTLIVDGVQKFDALSFQQGAFVEGGQPEESLILAMKRGRELEVKWVTPLGSEVSDTFDLGGFTAALRRIGRDC